MKIIYCDNNSTTQVDKKVLNEMLPYFCEKFGNASSIDHVYGNELLPEIKKARESIAKVIDCDFDEIIFTSGATESNNLAIMGTVEQLKEKGIENIKKLQQVPIIHPNDTLYPVCIYLNTWNNPVLSIEILLVPKSYRCLRLPPSF